MKFNHVYFLKDFNSFIESLKFRHDRGLDYRWDPDKDIKRMDKSPPWAEVPLNGAYKLPTALNSSVIDSMDQVNQELEDICKEKRAIRKCIDKNKTREASILYGDHQSSRLSLHS